MSDRREMTTKSRWVEAAPATKRLFFHDSKYSLMVGIMMTSALKASDSVGVHAAAAVARSPEYLSSVALAACSTLASGRASPNSIVPFLSKSAGVGAVKSGQVPHSVLSLTPNKLP